MNELVERVRNLQDGLKFAERTGYPIRIWPSYTLSGQGKAIVCGEKELRKFLPRELELSPVHEVQLDAKP